jgi:para-nitrobenzyl esterase
VSLPVVVWIHGGGHQSGSASDQGPSGDGKYYDGSTLAARGVVVVSFNYRLGALGFLAHPDLDHERSPFDNQGMWDQVAALTWVHDNIDQFGGDESNVTIIGQGSGAADVCMHVVSPLSQGLFHQAIGQSGGCTVYQPEPADLARTTQTWVSDLSCADAQDQLECLRKAPLDKLLQAATKQHAAFVPVVDGEFLPEQPRQLYRLGRFEPVPFVLGSNSDEGTQFSGDFESVDNTDDYHAVLKKDFPDLSLETLCEIYPHDEFGDTPAGYRKALAHLYGDAFVRCSVEDTAERASDAAADVYLYEFGVPADGNKLAPSHAVEIGYVFGTEPKLSTKQSAVSDLMQSYWVDFARDGYPDRDDDLPAWPPLSSKDASRMQFAFESKLVGDTNKRACDFWRSVYSARFPTQP